MLFIKKYIQSYDIKLKVHVIRNNKCTIHETYAHAVNYFNNLELDLDMVIFIWRPFQIISIQLMTSLSLKTDHNDT
jgi:hypothetical protein